MPAVYTNTPQINIDTFLSDLDTLLEKHSVLKVSFNIPNDSRIFIGFKRHSRLSFFSMRTFSNKVSDISIDYSVSFIASLFSPFFSSNFSRIYKSSEASYVINNNKLNLILTTSEWNQYIVDSLDIDLISDLEIISDILVFSYKEYKNLMISGLNSEDLVFLFKTLQEKTSNDF